MDVKGIAGEMDKIHTYVVFVNGCPICQPGFVVFDCCLKFSKPYLTYMLVLALVRLHTVLISILRKIYRCVKEVSYFIRVSFNCKPQS